MKAMFEFSLPEENEEYKLHCQASDLHCAVWDYAEWLRGVCKHGDPKQFDADACRQKLYELLTERNVDL
jgi:hypothetical protein